MEDNIIHDAITTLNLYQYFENTDGIFEGTRFDEKKKDDDGQQQKLSLMDVAATSTSQLKNVSETMNNLGDENVSLNDRLKHDLLVEITKEMQHHPNGSRPSSPIITPNTLADINQSMFENSNAIAQFTKEEVEHDANLLIHDFEEKIQKLFDEIAHTVEDGNQHDHQKTISPKNLRLFMQKSNVLAMDDTVDEIMRLYDTSRDGYLSFDEFKQYMV